MRLTTKTRYALRAMVELAGQRKDRPLPLKVISKRQGIRPKYLEQLLRRLRLTGLVKSVKGPGGGYLLSRKPELISLLDIVKAVGESLTPVFCVAKNKRKRCPRYRWCPTRPSWKKLDHLIEKFFKDRTLLDLCRKR